MDPILSPWLIYLLWILTGLKVASLFVLCSSIFVAILCSTYGFIEEADWAKKKFEVVCYRFCNKWGCVSINYSKRIIGSYGSNLLCNTGEYARLK